MRIQDNPPLHLTYCLNIHPGESWRENFTAITEKATAVRDRLARNAQARRPFGLGLRLSRRAADELSAGGELDRLASFLRERDLYAFTINGFPYGTFHGAPVKRDVYLPDWRTLERVEYTILLAEILARLLPEGVSGSISTVPCAYKFPAPSADDVTVMARNLCAVAGRLDRIRRSTSRTIVLTLEPEPDCLVETTEETLRFFEDSLLPAGREELVRSGGRSASQSEDIIRRHVGVCLDLAHAAVEFEEPLDSLRRLAAAGIVVGKVQLSAALAAEATPEALAKLAEFSDPVYLHQVKVRRAGGEIASYADLPEALADPAARENGSEWRVHFHVPLFVGEYGPLRSTAGLLGPKFWRHVRGGPCEHLEIETYTFHVLPEAMRTTDVVENVVREYQWVMGKLR